MWAWASSCGAAGREGSRYGLSRNVATGTAIKYVGHPTDSWFDLSVPHNCAQAIQAAIALYPPSRSGTVAQAGPPSLAKPAIRASTRPLGTQCNSSIIAHVIPTRGILLSSSRRARCRQSISVAYPRSTELDRFSELRREPCELFSRNSASSSGHSGRSPSSHSETVCVSTRSIRLRSAIFSRTSVRCLVASERALAHDGGRSSARRRSARISSSVNPSSRARRTNMSFFTCASPYSRCPPSVRGGDGTRPMRS